MCKDVLQTAPCCQLGIYDSRQWFATKPPERPLSYPKKHPLVLPLSVLHLFMTKILHGGHQGGEYGRIRMGGGLTARVSTIITSTRIECPVHEHTDQLFIHLDFNHVNFLMCMNVNKIKGKGFSQERLWVVSSCWVDKLVVQWLLTELKNPKPYKSTLNNHFNAGEHV